MNTHSFQANQILGDPSLKIRRDGIITIENGYIVEILENVQLNQNIKNFIICPCLIDAHTHLFLSGTTDMSFRKCQQELTKSEIQKQIKTHIQAAMSYGVLSVRDMGDINNSLAEVSCPESFRLLNTGPGYCLEDQYGQLIAIPLAHMEDLPFAISKNTFSSRWIKIVQSGINSLTDFETPCAYQFSESILTDAVKIAHQRGLRVATHANGEKAVAISIKSNCDSIEHGYKMGRENLKRMAEGQILWIPTIVAMKNLVQFWPGTLQERDNAKRYVDDQMEQIFWAREYGVPILAGSDAGSFAVNHGKGLWEEIQIFVETGMSFEEAISCASSKSALLLGGWEEFGLLTPGKQANFVILESSVEDFPKKQIQPKEVWINGKQFNPLSN